MKLIRTAAAAALVVGGAGLAGLSTAADAATTPAVSAGHAVFVQTDATTGNRILAYTRASDGTLSLAGNYPTGGKGAGASGATADPLASQGSLTLADHGTVLLSVNAGSNTLSVFSVSGSALTRTQEIGSGGIFPNSISVHGSEVAVLNAGGAGDVAVFHLDGAWLTRVANDTRSLGLSNATDPFFLDAPGQVSFTPDGAHVVVSTKLSTNSYEVFGVVDGYLTTKATITPSATPVPFAINYDSAGNLVAAEAATSTIATYSIDGSGKLTLIGQVSDGQKALCWIATSNGTVFGANAGSGNISTFSLGSDGTPTLANATAGTEQAGATDLTVASGGRFLYAQAGGSGTLNAYAISATGALTQIETISNLPLGSEGIAAS